MKIGFSFWGFLGNRAENTFVNTPDGARGDRWSFYLAATRMGHDVICLQTDRLNRKNTNIKFEDVLFPDIDILFCDWRWKTWKNDKVTREALGKNIDAPFEPDWQRQEALIGHYRDKCPIVLLDGDLKMKEEDELRYGDNVIICDPCVSPKFLVRKRHSLPWCSDFLNKIELKPSLSRYGYIGNNYNRNVQFSKYYGDCAQILKEKGIDTTVWGNWLEKSPERQSPEEILKMYPHIQFEPRVAFSDIFEKINSCLAVTHITTDEYAKYGNITCRFAETIEGGAISLIPTEYKHALPIGLDDFVVQSSEDVIRCVNNIKSLSIESRKNIIHAQQRALMKIVDINPESKVKFLENVIKGVI